MNKYNSVKICIVLVNYNGHQDTIKCLESIYNINYKNFSIVLVDNSDTLESLNTIAGWLDEKNENKNKIQIKDDNYLKYTVINENESFIGENEKLTIIKANSNKGFAAANNIAISRFNDQYNWFWLLNNDTVVASDCLIKFSSYITINAENRLGMVGTNIYDYINPSKLQAIGGTYNKWLGISKNIIVKTTNCENRTLHFSKNADYIIGASMFVSKEFINDVGLMEEKYFLFFEEIDWAIRGKKKQYKLGYVCDCNVYHKEGGSIGSASDPKRKSLIADYYSTRNKILFTKIFFPVLLPIIYVSMIGSFFFRLKRLQFDRAVMIIRIMFTDSKSL